MGTSGTSARPRYNDAYSYRRVLNVYFYTSNTDKLLQARVVLSRFGQNVHFYRGHREPYEEIYDGGVYELLKHAVNQINKEFRYQSVLFIEDTSLRIESLSDGDDFPGMRVKEWFSQTNFDELDSTLKAKGNDRRVVVKSDIALCLPSLSQPIFCNGETSGLVAETSPNFETNPQYPWLTPDTFNGWFIPDECHKRLGEMEFEESLEFDFRAKALIDLAYRINELNAAVNVAPQLLTHRINQNEFHRNKKSNHTEGAQLRLGLKESVIGNLLVIGPKCAGKTTFGDYLQNRDRYSHIEASTVLRELANRQNVYLSSSKEALIFLRNIGFDAVSKEISDYFIAEPREKRLNVITGFRTVEETAHFLREFPNSLIIYVDADPRIRFERHIRRSRTKQMRTYSEFTNNDEDEAQFGLLRVGELVADVIIRNDAELAEYHAKIDKFIDRIDTYKRVTTVQRSETARSLVALKALRKRATCEEISEKSAKTGIVKVRKYNTNRALKGVPEFARRYEGKNENLLSYSLTKRGRGFIDLLELLDKL